MKLRPPLTVLLVASATVGAIWLLNKPAPAPEKTAEAPKAAPAPMSMPKTTPTAQVAAPILPPAPKSADNSQPAAMGAAAPITAGDPHLELNTAIDDISNMLQTGNITGLIENYAPPNILAQMPPEAKAQMEQMMSDPRAQQQIQFAAQAFQQLKGAAPTMNDAGDKATYQISPPAGMAPPGVAMPQTIPITFIKIDGRWYINDGPGEM